MCMCVGMQAKVKPSNMPAKCLSIQPKPAAPRESIIDPVKAFIAGKCARSYPVQEPATLLLSFYDNSLPRLD